MNKYQEAINDIQSSIRQLLLSSRFEVDLDELDSEFQITSNLYKLQLLVNKETPKKPIDTHETYNQFDDTICPVCKTRVFGQIAHYTKLNFCHNCGQKLDWTKDE